MLNCEMLMRTFFFSSFSCRQRFLSQLMSKRSPLLSTGSELLPHFPRIPRRYLSAEVASASVPFEGSSLKMSSKKQKTAATTAAASDSAMSDEFASHAEYLNALNDKRERIVKASRDVTINSKKVIFQVHRISKENKEEIVERAEKDLENVTIQFMSKLVKELNGADFWKLRRAYSPAVQEYVEAATFCRFCKDATLMNLDEINANLALLDQPSSEPLQINILDYLLGVADVTGELMRLAIGRISDGEIQYAEQICGFVRDIYRDLSLLVPKMDDNAEMKKKMEVMFQSMVKIEKALFSIHVRGSEYVPMLGSEDRDFSFLGIEDL